VRALHLIDPGNPGGGACTLRLLADAQARLTSVDHVVLLIGNRRHEDLARRCGAAPAGRLAPPLNQPALAAPFSRAFRRFVDRHERAGGAFDVVHAWSARSAILAGAALPSHRRLATLSLGPVSGFMMQVLATINERRPTPMLATSVAVKRDYVAMGLSGDHIEVLRPAVHPEAVEHEARDAIRARWGVAAGGNGDGATFVIALLAEPLNWCDARAAASIMALAAEAGRDVVLLVHPRAGRREEARRWTAALGLDHRIVLEDDLAEPWRVMHGLDAALLLGDDTSTLDLRRAGSAFSLLLGGGRRVRPMPGVMPALWAMSAGVPVIAEAGFAVREIIDDGVTGLLVPPRDVNQAADRIVRLCDDRTIAGRIGAAAKARVHERFHVSAYCVRLKDVYERIVGGRDARVVAEENEAVIELRTA
jgi:hypothetical protein